MAAIQNNMILIDKTGDREAKDMKRLCNMHKDSSPIKSDLRIKGFRINKKGKLVPILVN